MDNQTISPETKQPSKAKKYFKRTVISIGVLFAVLLLTLISDISNDPSTATPAEQSTKSEESTEVASATEATVEPFNLEVTSQIVKKVDGKYRYFFDIRNKDTKNFDGKVTINMLKANGNKLGTTTIEEDRALKPDLGIARFIDANTGPVPIFAADLAITKFTYEVKINNKVVKTGEGVISDKFDDLN